MLGYVRKAGLKGSYSPEQMRLMQAAQDRWGAFLLGQSPDPREFEQHLLIMDIAEETTIKDLPNNFNRFIAGNVTFDILASKSSLMTFAKLGRFMFFGIIQPGRHEWDGTKIRVRNGLLRPGRFTVPHGLLGVLKDKARATAAATKEMSPRQVDLVDADVRKKIDAFADSDQFRAIRADAEMFGVDSVLHRKR